MELWIAVVLLILAIIGIVFCSLCLKNRKKLRVVCITLCVLIAIILAGYIGLTAIFIDAARNKPPTN